MYCNKMKYKFRFDSHPVRGAPGATPGTGTAYHFVTVIIDGGYVTQDLDKWSCNVSGFKIKKEAKADASRKVLKFLKVY